MSSICAKGTQIRTLIKGFSKISIFFKKLPQISHIHIFKFNWQLIDQLHLPYNFHTSSMEGILFFNYASCQSLMFPVGFTVSIDIFMGWMMIRCERKMLVYRLTTGKIEKADFLYVPAIKSIGVRSRNYF